MLGLLYRKLILKYPLTVLIVLIISILSFGSYVSQLEIDASAETLLLDDDKDLAFARTIEERFKGDDILILVYKPKQDLLSKGSLKLLPRFLGIESRYAIPTSSVPHLRFLLYPTKPPTSRFP